MSDTLLQEKRTSIKRFMPHFVNALQIDNDKEISDEELNNLRVIIKSSSITSTNTAETSVEEEIWIRRNYCKDVMKAVIDKINDLGDFRVKIPRKRDEKGNLPTHVYCCVDRNTASGLRYSLCFYLEWRGDNIIELGAELSRADNHSIQEFHEVMGDNPLKLKRIPVFWEWGGYGYENIISFNSNDYTIEQQVINIIRNIISSIE